MVPLLSLIGTPLMMVSGRAVGPIRSYGQPATQAPGSLANIATLRLPPAVILHDQDYEDHRSEELYDAAARGDLRHVHELLEEGVDPD